MNLFDVMTENVRLESELLDRETELAIATETLCDALTMIEFLRRDLIPSWKSSPVEQRESLQAEIEAMRAEIQRYTRAAMQ